MNSKLPPKYTILFLLLFVSIPNKEETALNSAQLYLADMAVTGKAYLVSASTSIVSDAQPLTAMSDLESYQWYTDIKYNI